MNAKLWIIRFFGFGAFSSLVAFGLFVETSPDINRSSTATAIPNSEPFLSIPVPTLIPTLVPQTEQPPAATATATATATSTSTPVVIMRPVIDPSVPGAFLGAYLPELPGSIASLMSFEQQIGRKMAIAHWFQAWGSSDAPFRTDAVNALHQLGVVPLISWEPWERTTDIFLRLHQPDFQLALIADGHFDGYIRSWADSVAQLDGPVLIRFAHEMHGRWYPWSINRNGNTTEDFINAWKHVHDIFQERGATNVQWVWNPNWNDEWTATLVRSTYPGDDYVDWIGITIFNWGTLSFRNRWDSMSDVLDWQYRFATEYGKPIVLAEFASAEFGGDKGAWIIESFDVLQTSYPQVKMVVWFNQPTARYAELIGWAVDSSLESLRAFREAVDNPYYLEPQLIAVETGNHD